MAAITWGILGLGALILGALGWFGSRDQSPPTSTINKQWPDVSTGQSIPSCSFTAPPSSTSTEPIVTVCGILPTDTYNEVWPWMAELTIRGSTGGPVCGGALIGDQWVLTAAHCLRSAGASSADLVVRLGAVNAYSWVETEYGIHELQSHPNYTDYAYANDLAIIKLSQRVLPNHICLPASTGSPDEYAGQRATVIGWHTGVGKMVRNDLLVWNKTACSMSSAGRRMSGIGTGMLCADDNDWQQFGHIGGSPLMHYNPELYIWSLIGVLAVGDTVGVEPGLYTRVSEYVDWINENMQG